MKKRKATLCLALAAVFGISSVAGCSKTPNNSGQDEKAAESQAGSHDQSNSFFHDVVTPLDNKIAQT